MIASLPTIVTAKFSLTRCVPFDPRCFAKPLCQASLTDSLSTGYDLGVGHHHGHHDHPHACNSPNSGETSVSSLKIAMGLTFVFCLAEAITGYMANSLALLADSLHMATDSISIGFALWMQVLSTRPATPRMSFGYKRAEILGAAASSVTLLVLVVFLVQEALGRISNPEVVQGAPAFWVATLGLLVNLIVMRVLSGGHSLGVRAAYLHVLMDCLGSVGAIISGALIYFKGWMFVDTWVTLISAAFMVWGAFGLLRDAVGILMESAPDNVDPERVKSDLAELSGVDEVHDLHIWSVGSGSLALSVHLISRDGDALLERANKLLEKAYGIVHTTIQVEHPDRFQSHRCYDCVPK